MVVLQALAARLPGKPGLEFQGDLRRGVRGCAYIALLVSAVVAALLLAQVGTTGLKKAFEASPDCAQAG